MIKRHLYFFLISLFFGPIGLIASKPLSSSDPGYFEYLTRPMTNLSNFCVNTYSNAMTAEKDRYEPGSYPTISCEGLDSLFHHTWFQGEEYVQIMDKSLDEYIFQDFPSYLYEYSSNGVQKKKSFIIYELSYGNLTLNKKEVQVHGRRNSNNDSRSVFENYINKLSTATKTSDLSDYVATYSNEATLHTTPYSFFTTLSTYIPENERHTTNMILDIPFCKRPTGGTHTYTTLVLRLLAFNDEISSPQHFSIIGGRVEGRVSQDEAADLVSLFQSE